MKFKGGDQVTRYMVQSRQKIEPAEGKPDPVWSEWVTWNIYRTLLCAEMEREILQHINPNREYRVKKEKE